MEVGRSLSDEHPSGTNGESNSVPLYPVGSEPDLMSESSLKRRRPSTSKKKSSLKRRRPSTSKKKSSLKRRRPSTSKKKSSLKRRRRRSTSEKALSDRTRKLLIEKISFPNVSKCRLKYIKGSYLPLSIICKDAHQRSHPVPIFKECKMGSYFDTECPIYSESFADVPKVEVGKQLNVLDLLGGKLLRFSTSSQNVHSTLPTKFTSYVGSRDSGMCMPKSGMSIPGKGLSNVLRVQSPILKRCVNSIRGGVMASTTSTTTSTVNVTVESTLNLKGKYVMICCVFVPSIWSSKDGPTVYHTALASHELARRDDFVLVVVPMMRNGFTLSYSAYQHFLSGFSCLAVPFDDSRRREYICSALGFDGEMKATILDPSQKVLDHSLPEVFDEFGGAEHDLFPFTWERQDICVNRDDVLEDRSLNELLGLSETDVLYNIEYLAGSRLQEDGRITISELKQKFVGLYVYYDGRSLKKLQEVHEECRRLKYELEIVVVCCPFHKLVPPKLHEELLIDAFARLKLLGFWFFPFDNTVCHRLQRMCEIDSHMEGLFIVDPNEKYVDPYGLPIYTDFGMDSYPFTRRTVIEKEFERKMGLRFNSLLPCEIFFGSTHPHYGIHVPMAVLENKIVIVYLYREPQKFYANKLAAWYKKNIRKKHSNVEVVAVSLNSSSPDTEKYFKEMGWLIYHTDPSKSAKIRQEFFHPLCGAPESVVAFGEDGRIQSVDASHILECQGPPFSGDLRDEIENEFCDKGGYAYMAW